MRRVMLRASQLGWRVFRNNVGFGWIGKPCTACQNILRRIRFGLCTGSSDLVGWKSIEVTPDMVGKRIAIFTAIETKTETGRATKEQIAFITAVHGAGGHAAVVRGPEEL
jgi:hypothetical protein